MSLVERAPAKINLGLHVLRERPDGYHDVETVLHRLDWADTITAQPANTLSMTCSDPELPTDDSNLCLQAARKLAAACNVTDGAELHLEKRVPYGAGLGGGSSDAAATLRLLTELWDIDPEPTQLRSLGRELGADVPFFLHEAPAAYATGRGDALTPLYGNDHPYQLPYPLIVVVPPIKISTQTAYARISPRDAGRPSLPDLVRSNDLARWRSALVNDFERAIAADHPAIGTARTWLSEAGANYVSLSGSGAAVYGVFASTDRAEAAFEDGRSREERIHLMPGTERPSPATDRSRS